jgi:hypothetical protein
MVTTALILQIQQTTLDSKSSITDVLRKAKVACTKLGLGEFGKWVDLELAGYMNIPLRDLPEYRKLQGIPEAFNPYQGWQPIVFATAKDEANWSTAPLGMSVPAIEESLRAARHPEGYFSYPYPPEAAAQLRAALPFKAPIQIKLGASQILDILTVVRNIILEWTMDMEKQGILGTDLTFNEEERQKSAAATAQTVNNIHIAQVGSFVQRAEHSVVEGSANAIINLDRVYQFVEQVEQMLSAADIPKSVKDNAETALLEVKQAAAHPHERGRLRTALQAVSRAVAPAGEHLLRIAVDAGLTKLLSGS